MHQFRAVNQVQSMVIKTVLIYKQHPAIRVFDKMELSILASQHCVSANFDTNLLYFIFELNKALVIKFHFFFVCHNSQACRRQPPDSVLKAILSPQ